MLKRSAQILKRLISTLEFPTQGFRLAGEGNRLISYRCHNELDKGAHFRRRQMAGGYSA